MNKYMSLALLANVINISCMMQHPPIQTRMETSSTARHTLLTEGKPTTAWEKSYEECCCKYTLYLASIAAVVYTGARTINLFDGQPLGDREPSTLIECCMCLPLCLHSLTQVLDASDPTHSCLCDYLRKIKQD